jgi:hypothetical protein
MAASTVFAVALMVLIQTPAGALDNENYGYVRSLEGYSDLIQNGSNEIVKLTTNYPILVGDQIRLSDQARAETVLPDGSYLRLGNNTELEFRQMARSADTHGASNHLLLHQGEAQLITHADASRSEYFRFDTSNATIYLSERGRYRIFSDGASWTEVSVRLGSAEIVTESGSATVQSGETLFIQGARDPLLEIGSASQLTALEIWGDELGRSGKRYASEHVDSSLAYSSASLYRHGSWMLKESRYVWRPHVSRDWRPYHSGWWAHTPSGLTWISTEPWGWLTYHYGVWDYGPSFGWVWHPGTYYTPAAVYWYWGPTHVGWIPAGYYTSFYGHGYPHYIDPYVRHDYHRYSGFGYRSGGHLHYRASDIALRTGVHGTAGGAASHWNDWTFTRHHRLGYRGGHAFFKTGSELSNHGTFKQTVPEGIITTDTRALTPNLWHQPNRAMEALRAHPKPPTESRPVGGSSRRELTNLDSWVARDRTLPEAVNRTMQPTRSSMPAPTPTPYSRVSQPGVSDQRSGGAPMTSRSADPKSIAETWRLGRPREAPARRWGSDLRERRLSRRSLNSTSRPSLDRSKTPTFGRSIGNRSFPRSRSGSFPTRSMDRSSPRFTGPLGLLSRGSSTRSSVGRPSGSSGRRSPTAGSSRTGSSRSGRSTGSRSNSGGISRGGGKPPSR